MAGDRRTQLLLVITIILLLATIFLFAQSLSQTPGKLNCVALPAEDHQDFPSCDAGYYELMKWCSGDCGSDDAKVTICCIG